MRRRPGACELPRLARWLAQDRRHHGISSSRYRTASSSRQHPHSRHRCWSRNTETAASTTRRTAATSAWPSWPRKIRRGSDVRVVDASTGADLTAETLVQIIFEDRHAARLLPVSLLQQMIRMGDDALAEFLGRYVTWALESISRRSRGSAPSRRSPPSRRSCRRSVARRRARLRPSRRLRSAGATSSREQRARRGHREPPARAGRAEEEACASGRGSAARWKRGFHRDHQATSPDCAIACRTTGKL